MLLLLLGLAVVSYVIGAVRRGDISNLFRRVTLRSTPQVLFLESRQDKALFLETDGDRQRVIVRQPNQSDWRIASQDDFTATNPALSPDGAWVVYLSTRTAPQLVLVPLDRSEYVTYTSAALADFSARNRITVTTICPWTPIAWAADSTRVAFFGCAENPSLSQMFVANVLTATLDLQSGVVTGTLVTGENPRQVLWIGADRVMVTFPATTSDQAETIETFDIP
ncbi:MAG: PD40 domain-containing protein [Anaerolineae bacterium]|nr:PD40 domain-containing protein [Anaerolineae bacterium]